MKGFLSKKKKKTRAVCVLRVFSEWLGSLTMGPSGNAPYLPVRGPWCVLPSRDLHASLTEKGKKGKEELKERKGKGGEGQMEGSFPRHRDFTENCGVEHTTHVSDHNTTRAGERD